MLREPKINYLIHYSAVTYEHHVDVATCTYVLLALEDVAADAVSIGFKCTSDPEAALYLALRRLCHLPDTPSWEEIVKRKCIEILSNTDTCDGHVDATSGEWTSLLLATKVSNRHRLPVATPALAHFVELLRSPFTLEIPFPMVNSTPARRATTLPDDHEPKPVDRRPTVPEDHDYDSKVPEPSQKAPKLYLKDGEVEAFRHLAHSIVSRTLAHECEFRQLGCPEPNSKHWKLLKRQDDLSVYKQRVNEQSESNRSSKTYTVKCVGTLEGTLEDLLYGTHSKNREEMHATAAFLHHSHMDCAVLNVLDNGTDENPYRQLALKWFIAETFGDARLVKHRDWFNIESTGMGTDSFGRRYGYFLAKFADHPGCPPMPEDSDVIRGRMNMCCIYRQERGSKVVDVYAKGSMDLGGGMPAFLTSSSSCAMMFSMAVSMDSAEAKRLTKLYLQHAQREAEEENVRETEEELERSQKDTTESVVDFLTASAISSSAASSTDGIKLSKRSKDPCNVCGKKPAMAKLVRASHRKCGICRERVCSKCNTKRKLFGASGPVAMACCKICILASKRLYIDPRDPCPILPSKIKR